MTKVYFRYLYILFMLKLKTPSKIGVKRIEVLATYIFLLAQSTNRLLLYFSFIKLEIVEYD